MSVELTFIPQDTFICIRHKTRRITRLTVAITQQDYVYKNNISVSNYIDWITQHLDSDLTEVKADNSVEDFSDDGAEDDKNNADGNDADDVAASPVKYNPKQVKRFCKLPADSENNDWADYTEINGSIKGKEKGDKVLRKLVTCLIQMQKVSRKPYS